jgi:hypothetical protein
MNALVITKFAVRTIVGFGASSIVHQVIKNNVQPETAVEATSQVVASIAIGGLVSDACKKYTDAQIDEIADSLKKLFKKSKPEEEVPTADVTV